MKVANGYEIQENDKTKSSKSKFKQKPSHKREKLKPTKKRNTKKNIKAKLS